MWQYESSSPKFMRYALEMRLCVSKIFWLRDVGQKVGQRPYPANQCWFNVGSRRSSSSRRRRRANIGFMFRVCWVTPKRQIYIHSLCGVCNGKYIPHDFAS